MAVVRLTAEGRERLEADLVRLSEERDSISARIADARAGGGDPTENLDLRDAIEDLERTERRIGELQALLASAEPLELVQTADGVARLGSKVVAQHADGEEAIYLLVSPAEAEPRKGRISVVSPIGRALEGARAGQRVQAVTPAGEEELQILKVA